MATEVVQMQDPDEIEEAGDLEETEGSKRSYKKIILLAGIVIVILAVAGAGVYFTVGLGFLGISEEPAEEVAGHSLPIRFYGPTLWTTAGSGESARSGVAGSI